MIARSHLLLLALALSGCDDLLASGPLAPLDEPYFRCRVQPVVAKYCASLACHGSADRYYRLYARNRLRLSTDERDRNNLMTDDERSFNFDSSRAMVDPNSPARSLFLLKALDQTGGGYYHGGAEEWKQGDVFLDPQATEFRVLVEWTEGGTEDPECIEPGSNS